MLFIWDIHIHHRYGELTIATIRDYITEHDDDNHIVFLWDYVYHFSYHRSSLLALLDLFLELANNNKHVYVLAGNHDWLGQHFVYSETEKILNQHPNEYLHIITTPQSYKIMGKDFLFIPYILSRSWYTPEQTLYTKRDQHLQILKESTNINEKESYLLNAYIEDESKKYDDLTIIHHYYTAQTSFPGMKAQFHYKDKAISPHFLEYNNIKFISGHIHHSFSYKNYLCLGAIWSTSPLENNVYQWLSTYNIKEETRYLSQIAINPYISIYYTDEKVTKTTIIKQWNTIKKESEQSFQSQIFSLIYQYIDLPLSRTTVTINSDESSYESLDKYIDASVRNQTRDIQLKQSPLTMDKAIQDLVDSSSNFSSSRSNWKQLLHDYLETKYGEKKWDYLTLLHDLDIKI